MPNHSQTLIENPLYSGHLYGGQLLQRVQFFGTAGKVQAKLTTLLWSPHIFCGKIKMNFYSIFKCFYLTHLSTFTFTELFNISKAFVSQVVSLDFPLKNRQQVFPGDMQHLISLAFQSQQREYNGLDTTGIW